MKRLSSIVSFACLSSLAVSLAGSSPTMHNDTSDGLSHAQPGAAAIVQLELKPEPGVLFNRLGPSRIRVSHPFGKTLEANLPRGTPWPQEPQTYDQSVPPLTFRFDIPTDAKPGAYPIKLEAELFLCDALRHICYRSDQHASIRLEVGSVGLTRSAALALTRPKP